MWTRFFHFLKGRWGSAIMESKYEGRPKIKGSSWISDSFLSAAKSSAPHEGSRKKIKAISCELSAISC